ncbi:MT-A70-domain-containing protein [Scheffersomyces xylosifermentans]|uniref:MT-A70-domain-containing protein n=1 Tax=Scheffersomyces xylosifermentans TaxID=1304137 RepID=UPI00315D9BEF
MTAEVAKFQPFIKFLLQNERVVENPIRGQIMMIMTMYYDHLRNEHEHGSQVDNGDDDSSNRDDCRGIDHFVDFLVQFNQISGKSLVFNKEISSQNSNASMINSSRLVWIFRTKLLLLQDRLVGKEARNIEYKSHLEPSEENHNSIELLDALDKPVFSQIEATEWSKDKEILECNFATLDNLLQRRTASSQLCKHKASLKSAKKAYFEVCNNNNHNQVLANISFNKRNGGSGGFNKSSFPSVIQTHQKIDECQSMMSQEIYQCSKRKIHFLPIISSHTDLYLGDCSYLDTCHKMKSCRYLHYYSLNPLVQANSICRGTDKVKCIGDEYTMGECFTEYEREITPAQWINCDIRYLPFSVLGKFAAIISDPAWDIHMSLPYGTCKDDELLSLPMHELQDEGIILLWVTGRSIEIGRRALLKWGYRVSDEMIWVKLNQLKRTIVTGRTGHWLNHSKEHLLLGVKGDPYWLNRGIDTDVVVSATRATSRKPDEIYDIVERLVGVHSRKLEIFGRDHNTRPGWLTIGNQLQGTLIQETEVKQRYTEYLQNSKTNS